MYSEKEKVNLLIQHPEAVVDWELLDMSGHRVWVHNNNSKGESK